MAGLTERRGATADSFWTWRALMYRFLENLRPDDVEAIATQVYIEMLRAGYTSVAEFQYLHHDAGGAPYANRAEVGERLLAAADASGIAQTLLPVLYAHDNFGGTPPTSGQRRFINSVADYSGIVETLVAKTRGSRAQRIGIAPHSLRAVTPAMLNEAVALAGALGPDTPIHLNLSAQLKEVNDCLAWSGQRPIAWLLDHVGVDGIEYLTGLAHRGEDACRQFDEIHRGLTRKRNRGNELERVPASRHQGGFETTRRPERSDSGVGRSGLDRVRDSKCGFDVTSRASPCHHYRQSRFVAAHLRIPRSRTSRGSCALRVEIGRAHV